MKKIWKGICIIVQFLVLFIAYNILGIILVSIAKAGGGMDFIVKIFLKFGILIHPTFLNSIILDVIFALAFIGAIVHVAKKDRHKKEPKSPQQSVEVPNDCYDPEIDFMNYKVDGDDKKIR